MIARVKAFYDILILVYQFSVSENPEGRPILPEPFPIFRLARIGVDLTVFPVSLSSNPVISYLLWNMDSRCKREVHTVFNGSLTENTVAVVLISFSNVR